MRYLVNSEILRAGRVMVGLTQIQLAELAGAERRAIAKLEDADSSQINIKLAAKVMEILQGKGLEFIGATQEHGDGLRWRSPDGKPSI